MEKFSINFIRHGDTEYKETKLKKSADNVNFTEFDLTDLGIEQIKKISETLASEIAQNNGAVILWSSPAWRAQDSENIIAEALKKKDIKIYKKKISQTLGPIKLNYIEEEDEIKNNMRLFFKWLNYVAKRCINEKKKIYVVCVSHYEFLNPIMEDIFHFNLKKGEGYQKAERMSLSFSYNKKIDMVIIDAEVRGIKVKNIYFNSKNKKFEKLTEINSKQ